MGGQLLMLCVGGSAAEGAQLFPSRLTVPCLENVTLLVLLLVPWPNKSRWAWNVPRGLRGHPRAAIASRPGGGTLGHYGSVTEGGGV